MLFYEPSTRTSSSFQAAMLRLGGQVVSITDTKSSSVTKGETLEDTVRTLESYSDVIAMRHPETGSAKRAAAVLKIPLLNGGDGSGEHPTQALLDLFTIINLKGKVDGLTVTFLGDLKYGRTVHSLAKLLSLFKVKINYISPDFLRLPEEIYKAIEKKGVPQEQHSSLDVLKQTDVLYVTRVQKERFSDLSQYEKASKMYVIGKEVLDKIANPHISVLHPLPRVNELLTDLDDDPRCGYFEQMRSGLYVRMALLALVLGKSRSSRL